MPQRRRFATREELAKMIYPRVGENTDVDSVLNVLSALGVDLGALIQITADEPEADA